MALSNRLLMSMMKLAKRGGGYDFDNGEDESTVIKFCII